MSSANCTCLHADSNGEFRHYVHCAAVTYAKVAEREDTDNSDIRALAEVAANSDIDLAVTVYRAYLLRGAK